MYKKILVALENSRTDDAVVVHIAQLAGLLGSELLLLHVADGFAARNFDQLKLVESDEMKADRAYLGAVADRLKGQGLNVATTLALGNPPTEIVRVAQSNNCDLIALTAHGHKLMGDIFLGSTIDKVRHNTAIPVLVVRASTVASR